MISGECLSTQWLWTTSFLNGAWNCNSLLLPVPSGDANQGYNNVNKSLTFLAAWSLARCWFHHPSCFLVFEDQVNHKHALTSELMARDHFRWQYPVCAHCKNWLLQEMIGCPKIRNIISPCQNTYRPVTSHFLSWHKFVFFCIFFLLPWKTSLFCFAITYPYFKTHHKCYLLGEVLLDSSIQEDKRKLHVICILNRTWRLQHMC